MKGEEGTPQRVNKPLIESFKEIYKDVTTDPPLWKSDPNEPYSIRSLNPRNSEETQIFTDIDRHPEALRNMLPPKKSKPKNIDYLINANQMSKDYKTKKKDPRQVFGIVDDKNHLVGWVQYYREENLGNLQEQANIPENAVVLEISYGKLFSKWPKYTHFKNERTNLPDKESKGVAISGVKQSLIKLREMEKTTSAEIHPERPIFVSAYTYPDNIASEKVLLQNGFKKLEKMVNDKIGKPNNVWIKQI